MAASASTTVGRWATAAISSTAAMAAAATTKTSHGWTDDHPEAQTSFTSYAKATTNNYATYCKHEHGRESQV